MSLEQEEPPSAASRFATTHWSVVLSAGGTQSPRAAEALETLSLTYWYPLYVYLRRKGLDTHEAEDMTQDFFAHRIVTRLIFKGVTPGQGKFRSWLLTSLQNFERNEWDRRKAQKRGGDRTHVSLDLHEVEGRYLAEQGHDDTPEKLYDRAWAMTLLDRTLENLRAKYVDNGSEPLFDELKRFLPGALSACPYAEVAVRLGKSEAAVKMAVSRLRREFGTMLRDEIEGTVISPEELRDELRHLLSVLGA
jgi:DNA-directed RNA polymerase specialized sigma24 family protein